VPGDKSLYDVVIIGGGPAGLSASLVLARANRHVVIVDAAEPRNQTARTLHNYLGQDGCSPEELLAAGRRDVARYGVEVVSDRATKVANLSQPDHTKFCVEMSHGKFLLARKVLFATGLRDELPAWPGFSECYGVSAHHCPYCDAFEYRGRTIAVYGKEPRKALGLAMTLLTWSPRVVVLTDGNDLANDPESRARIEKYKLGSQERGLRELLHHQGKLIGVEFTDGGHVDCVALFFNTSQSPCCNLPRELGCTADLKEQRPINRKQQTSVRGIYLAGDADGDVKFAIVAAAEGAKAAVAINRELQDEDLGAFEF
jgi:thioredoxin reductase